MEKIIRITKIDIRVDNREGEWLSKQHLPPKPLAAAVSRLSMPPPPVAMTKIILVFRWIQMAESASMQRIRMAKSVKEMRRK
jgi:hypothetical protein